jgi:hypothetical protein
LTARDSDKDWDPQDKQGAVLALSRNQGTGCAQELLDMKNVRRRGDQYPQLGREGEVRNLITMGEVRNFIMTGVR